MFGLLGWLFGGSFVAAILALLTQAIYNAIVPEINAATNAVRATLFTGIWAGTTGFVGRYGFRRQMRSWRKKIPFAQGKGKGTETTKG